MNKKLAENKLKEIILKNNLCISNNPLGIDIQWPKSYADLYYKKVLNKIYINNKSPRILELNQDNKTKIKLWKTFFQNPKIIQANIISNIDITKSIDDLNIYKFQIIFIDKYPYIKNLDSILEILKDKLKRKGLIIIENVYFNIPLITKLFFNHQARIHDFRLNRFIINNCLIEIQNYLF